MLPNPVILDSNTGRVNGLAADKNGWWWLAGIDGLSLFDGTSLQKVEIKNKKGGALITAELTRIVQSKIQEHILFLFSTSIGLIEFDKKTGTGTTYRADLTDPKALKSNFVVSLEEEDNGNFWVSTGNFTLSYFDREQGRFFNFRPEVSMPSQEAGILGDMVVCPLNPKHLWVASRFGLYRFDKTSHEFTLFPFEKVHEYFYSGKKLPLFADKQEKVLWLGKAEHGLWRYDPATGLPISEGVLFDKEKGYDHNFVRSIFAYDENTILVGSQTSGMAEFNRQTGDLIYSYKNYRGRNKSKFQVSEFFKDKGGDLWLCGVVGLFRMTAQKDPITFIPYEKWFGETIKYTKPPPYISKNNWLRADLFSANGKRLYLGTKKGDGLLVYETGLDSFWLIRYRSAPGFSNPDTWMDDLCEDDTKRLWIGSEKGLLFWEDGMQRIQKKELGFEQIDKSHLAALAFKAPFLYIGTSDNGVFRLNTTTSEIADFSPAIKKNLLPLRNISKLFFDSKGNLWIGSGSGLNIYQPENAVFLPYKEEKGGGSWLSEVSIRDIVELQNGDIYLTSSREGLIGYHPNIKEWKNYKNKERSHIAYGELVVTAEQKIVLSGRSSFQVFDPFLPYAKHPEIPRYYTGVGIQRSLIAFPDGRIWAGSNRGLSEFDVPKYVGDYASISLYIKNVVVPGKERWNAVQLNGLKEIELGHLDNTFSIEPGALNFALLARSYFLQKLEGVDKDWVEVKRNNTLTYSNLSPGTYHYRYRASDQTGRWAKETGSLDIIIRPPWWRSGWAYFVYACLFIAALVFARRQVVRREKLKSQLKVEQMEKESAQEIDQLRARFFANISHEFRTPLTLIKAPLEDLLTSRNNKEDRLVFYKMYQNTERLLHLVNQLLELSRLESGVLKLKNEPQEIFAFLRQLAGNFKSLADHKKLGFKINVPTEKTYLKFDKDKLEKIVLNLLSNALKFSPENGWVEVNARFSEKLIIEIGNNGEAIPPEEQPKIFERFYQAGDTRHQGAGIGLALAREFVELYGGKISVVSDAENGTWFRVELPLEKVERGAFVPTEVAGVSTQVIVPPMFEKDIPALASKQNEKKKPLLLLVEDHAEVRAYIHSKLENNFQIIEAEDGQQGWEKASEQLPDLIISDLMMPVMDGLGFCQKIKSDLRTDHIPFILLTAKADIESRLVGLETGADDYLAKPFDSRELLARCQNFIAQRKRLQGHFQQKIQLSLPGIDLRNAEEKFLQKAIALVGEHMGNAAFSVDDFARQMHLSRVHLHRKLKNLTGMSPSEFTRNLRLERAAQLLEAQADSVSQTAFQVGFNNLSYFAKCFRKKYGQAPSSFKKY